MKKHIFLLLISSVIFTSCAKSSSEESVEAQVPENKTFLDLGISEINPGIEAPDFTLQDLEGNSVTLSDYKESVVIVNFWASWCGPCRAEMPSMERMYAETKDSNIKFLAVNVGEAKSTAENFINENNYTFDVLLDSNNQVSLMYSARSIPTTYILDKDGIAVAGKIGTYEWDNPELINLLKDMAK